ncbi:mitogen-activated protein kinase tyrosine protein phosphatase sdp1 [Cymbomonas tetramitiformis]|uniref:Patatin n=1 Tax=Cymbomonas tetramitiformis TaxID=36881 RepID=A0AAE0G6W9_9CHLO|nr:mitogen-activated protein kinase tyrosine protein phosphatase sdp1 [Cymbomonas tetramitiformis]
MIVIVTAGHCWSAGARHSHQVKDSIFYNMELNAKHPKEVESSTNSSRSQDQTVGQFSCFEPFRCQPIELMTKMSDAVTTRGLGAIAGGGLLATLLILSSRNRAKFQRELSMQVAGMQFRSDKRRIVGSFEETFPWSFLDIVFTPRAVWSQVKLVCWLRFAYSAFFMGSEAIAELESGLKCNVHVQSALTYKEWRKAQLALDGKQRLEKPKALSLQPAQGAESIERPSEEEFEDSLDGADALHRHIRMNLKRGGTQEGAVQSNAQALEQMMRMQNISEYKKLELLCEIRQDYGRVALLLSGGASLGYFHVGVIKLLLEQEHLPRIIAGSSAGSIFAAIVCCCASDKEILDKCDFSNYTNRRLLGFLADAETNGYDAKRPEGWAQRLRSFWRKGELLNAKVMKDFIKDHVGDLTFREAYDKTGRTLNITVVPRPATCGSASGKLQLLNYITSPHVVVWSAVLASCAIPWLFGAVELYVKDSAGEIRPAYADGATYSDGSFGCDLPIERMKQLFDVGFFIVSQVNPLSHYDIRLRKHAARTHDPLAKLLLFMQAQATCYVQNLWATGWLQRNSVLSSLVPLWIQETEGDITLLAPVTVSDLTNLLSNLELHQMNAMRDRGERAVWPSMAEIEKRCLVDFTLDRHINRLKSGSNPNDKFVVLDDSNRAEYAHRTSSICGPVSVADLKARAKAEAEACASMVAAAKAEAERGGAGGGKAERSGAAGGGRRGRRRRGGSGGRERSGEREPEAAREPGRASGRAASEAEPEPRERRAAANAEAEAAANAEAEAAANAEAEAAANAEAEAAANAEAEAAANAEAEAAANAEAEAAANAEAEARAKVEAEAAANAEAEARAKVEAEAAANAEAEARAKVEAEAAKVEAEAKAEAQTEAEAQAEDETRAQVKAEAEEGASRNLMHNSDVKPIPSNEF